VRQVAQPQVTRRKFTVDEYPLLARAGILKEDDRVELLDGEIVEMSPIGSRHVDLDQHRVEVYRDPSPDGYRDVRVVTSSEPLAPLTFPDLDLRAQDVLGP
jgi:Uma2 family endonuclease